MFKDVVPFMTGLYYGRALKSRTNCDSQKETFTSKITSKFLHQKFYF